MKVTIEWQVRVGATEQVHDINEFAVETLRGLIASEMVPDDARVSQVYEGWNRHASVEVKWNTESEMEASDNYKVS